MFADFRNFESMNAVLGNETPECALAPDLECFVLSHHVERTIALGSVDFRATPQRS